MRLLIESDLEREEPKSKAWYAHKSTDTPLSIGEFEDKTVIKILERRRFSTGLLPPAVRWISADGKIVVFERPPAYFDVNFLPLKQDEAAVSTTKPMHFKLPLPWQVYVVGFGEDYHPVNIFTLLARTSIDSLDHKVYVLPLFNFYENGQLCTPIVPSFSDKERTIKDGIIDAYEMVWYSGFNYDLRDAINLGTRSGAPVAGNKQIPGRPRLRSIYDRYLYEWSQLSLVDTLYTSWPIGDPYPTLRTYIEKMKIKLLLDQGLTYSQKLIVSLMNIISNFN